MEYVYASLLLHSAGKKIDESNIGPILKSVGINVNQAQAKSIVAALENVNIDEALKTSAVPVAARCSPAPRGLFRPGCDVGLHGPAIPGACVMADRQLCSLLGNVLRSRGKPLSRHPCSSALFFCDAGRRDHHRIRVRPIQHDRLRRVTQIADHTHLTHRQTQRNCL